MISMLGYIWISLNKRQVSLEVNWFYVFLQNNNTSSIDVMDGNQKDTQSDSIYQTQIYDHGRRNGSQVSIEINGTAPPQV